MGGGGDRLGEVSGRRADALSRRDGLRVLGAALLAACDRRCSKSDTAPAAHANATDANVRTESVGSRASAEGGSGAAANATSLEGFSPRAFRRLTWKLPPPIERAVVLVPEGLPRGARLPFVIALHGRGEALKGPEKGALGWPDDYALDKALVRAASPPLTREDFGGFVTAERLRAHNALYAARPFRGLVVACPYVPDLDLADAESHRGYGKALLEHLLPRARRELPIARERAGTGIDGISLGGVVAVRAGLSFAAGFAAVGGIQPAINHASPEEWADLAGKAHRMHGTKLRLATSDHDFFRRSVLAVAEACDKRDVPHTLVTGPGPHDYPYNRGAGALELCFFHHDVLG